MSSNTFENRIKSSVRRTVRKLTFDTNDTYPMVTESMEMQLSAVDVEFEDDDVKEDHDIQHRMSTPKQSSPKSIHLIVGTPIKRNPNATLYAEYQNQSFTPPYKRIRNLRLLDSPATPKTILKKSAALPPPSCMFSSASSYYHMPTSLLLDRSFNKNPFTQESILNKSKKRSHSKRHSITSLTDKNTDIENESGNDTDESISINNKSTISTNKNYNEDNSTVRTLSLTTTSDSEVMNKKTHRLSLPCQNSNVNNDQEEEEEEELHVSKRIALQENNISRYRKEFVELELIGVGQFGSVHKCMNRLDGITYAIKKSLKPIAGSYFEKTALNEVYAHAVLGKHQHVVRYYSAWAEDNRMVIQNEYCNGGSLADHIAERKANNEPPMSENELKQLLCHISEGLRYIHSLHLVHMDIKPANIFISTESRCLHSVNYDSSDDGFEETEEISENEITYKIGDLGHVTSVTKPQVEEGDCRYLALEILNENYTHLQKADIFALGLTVYEAGGGGPLPMNGEEWQDIRINGQIKPLENSSDDFNDLIKLMISNDPELRPTATQLRHHKVLTPNGIKTRAQLRRELNAEKLKNEILSNQLEVANRIIETVSPVLTSTTNTINQNNFQKSVSRLIGKTVNRSLSTTIF